MNILLTPEMEQMVNEKVRAGTYRTASEVIDEGLRLLDQHDQDLEALRREIRAGFDAVDRGEYEEFDVSEAREFGERIKRRDAEWLARENSSIG